MTFFASFKQIWTQIKDLATQELKDHVAGREIITKLKPGAHKSKVSMSQMSP